MYKMLRLALAGLLLAGFWDTARAAPEVAASIKPVHSLVAGVMGDLAAPELLISGGSSPHTARLTPSEAGLLERADLVVWVGPALETSLARPIRNIVAPARSLALLRAPGVTLLRTRSGGVWDGDGHGHDHDHDHEHEHETAASGGEVRGIREGSIDTHLWLDPDNATAMVDVIASRLMEIDPDNARVYKANAAATKAAIAQADRRTAALLAPVAGRPFVVFHDAYQYLERHYGLNAVGAITLSPDRAPGARRVYEIRHMLAERDVRCVFREPQFAPDLVDTIVDGTGVRVGVLDPLGADLPPGPEAYPKLLTALGRSLQDCLAGRT